MNPTKPSVPKWVTVLAALVPLACPGVRTAGSAEPPAAGESAPGTRPAGEPKPAPPRELSAAELKELLATLSKEMGSIRTLRAAFVQEKHVSLFTEVVKVEGWTFFSRPDCVRLEMTAPFRSALIAQGKSVAKYEFADGQWQKLKLQSPDVVLKVTGQIAAWLQGQLDKEGIYTVSALAAADGQVSVVLVPKAEELRKYISATELGLSADRKRLVSVTIREPGGDFTRMTFSAEERDVELPKEIFSTSGPAPTDLGSLTEARASPAKPEDSP